MQNETVHPIPRKGIALVRQMQQIDEQATTVLARSAALLDRAEKAVQNA